VSRRVVRVSTAFFDQLDAQLGFERGVRGEPSSTDFLVTEMPAVVDAFASRFEELPEAVEGVPEARMVIATGSLVRAFAAYGLLTTDGSVELIGIEIPQRARSLPLVRSGGTSARSAVMMAGSSSVNSSARSHRGVPAGRWA
jgi:hypothetical protein